LEEVRRPLVLQRRPPPFEGPPSHAV
jgi:hypothetical protein